MSGFGLGAVDSLSPVSGNLGVAGSLFQGFYAHCVYGLMRRYLTEMVRILFGEDPCEASAHFSQASK